MSEDHKPDNVGELARIEAAGGFVEDVDAEADGLTLAIGGVEGGIVLEGDAIDAGG